LLIRLKTWQLLSVLICVFVICVVAGIIGALDPYTHKVNTASLSGEGKLELEGVRPLQTAAANIAASIMAGT
jgi:hypothetical protein